MEYLSPESRPIITEAMVLLAKVEKKRHRMSLHNRNRSIKNRIALQISFYPLVLCTAICWRW